MRSASLACATVGATVPGGRTRRGARLGTTVIRINFSLHFFIFFLKKLFQTRSKLLSGRETVLRRRDANLSRPGDKCYFFSQSQQNYFYSTHKKIFQVCNKVSDCSGGEDESDCAVNDSKGGKTGFHLPHICSLDFCASPRRHDHQESPRGLQALLRPQGLSVPGRPGEVPPALPPVRRGRALPGRGGRDRVRAARAEVRPGHPGIKIFLYKKTLFW